MQFHYLKNIFKKNLYSSGGAASSSYGGASGSGGNKRDYRGDYVSEHQSISSIDPNREVNQKLTALTKALSDATALLKTAGISTG